MEAPSKKKFIVTGIVSGLIYATIMTGFYYLTETPNSYLSFFIHFFLFGGLIAVTNYRASLKHYKNSKK